MLTWDFPPRETGGTAAHVVGLSHALAVAGHDVVVLTIADRDADAAAERSGSGAGDAHRGRSPVALAGRARSRRTASANHAVVKLGAATADSPLDGWRPDMVHGHDWRLGWAADTLARHHEVPFVLTMHGTERVRHGGTCPIGEPTDVNSIEWWLAFQADRLIAPTRFMVDQLVTDFELSPEHVVRVPNGIDPALWDGPADDPTEREPLVVSWGRVQYEKGFQVLARAMSTAAARSPHVSVHDRRPGELPARAADADRRRRASAI